MNEYERWEPEYAFGKEPNEFLKSCKRLLPPSGRALAVADGEGRNGVWLAEQGLDVLAIDFSPSAQRKARALAAERHVDVTFVQANMIGTTRDPLSTSSLKYSRNSARRLSEAANGPACAARSNPVGFSSS